MIDFPNGSSYEGKYDHLLLSNALGCSRGKVKNQTILLEAMRWSLVCATEEEFARDLSHTSSVDHFILITATWVESVMVRPKRLRQNYARYGGHFRSCSQP